MKKSRRTVEKTRPRPLPPLVRVKKWHWLTALAGALLLALAVYAPALRGPFLFDDLYLPFTDTNLTRAGLWLWVRGVRPLLMLSFWLNYRWSEMDPYSYHLLNLLLHFANSALVFLAARRILSWAGSAGAQRNILAAFAGGLFLLHPLQTEAVAYVASRSDVLSTAFFLGGLVLFLYRRSNSISWLAAAGVLVLFGAAVTTKENTAVLPLLLLLTDYYWNPGFSRQGARRNWRLYLPTVAAGALAGRFVLRVLMQSDTAGLSLKELTWYQYFFTQGRVIWEYLRMAVLPYGLSVDHDVRISRSLDLGALAGLVALAALVVAALWYRRRYPLASYGLLAFLVLLAPTSSVLPILDPIAERRMYLPLFGLLLAAAEFLRRWKTKQATLAMTLGAVLAISSIATYARAQVWSSSEALWTDAVAKAPNKGRPHFQLAFAYYTEGRCNAALEQYAQVARVEKPDYRLLIDWGLAYECAGHRDTALEKLNQAAALQRNAHVYSLIGLLYTRQGRREEATRALNTALKLDANYPATYVFLGMLHASAGDFSSAEQDYRHALALDPENTDARTGLALVQQQLRKPR